LELIKFTFSKFSKNSQWLFENSTKFVERKTLCKGPIGLGLDWVNYIMVCLVHFVQTKKTYIFLKGRQKTRLIR
jgi:hypothetical protein